MKRIAVTTDVGTFTRTTARPYTHVVVALMRADHWYVADRGTWQPLGFCGRLDLARKERDKWVGHFDGVRIYEIATGNQVN